MKFQIGDKVLVSHSNEEGEVVDIINEDMVMVEIRGVRFPVYNDQLDFPYFKRFTEKKLVPEKKEKKYIDQILQEKIVTRSDREGGVQLVFLPKFIKDEFDDELVQLLKVHLVNGTEEGYQFHFTLTYQGNPSFELKNQLYPGQDFYLMDIAFENINDNAGFGFEFSLLHPDMHKAEFHEVLLKLKPKHVFNKVEEIKQKGRSTFSYQLFTIYPDKQLAEKLDLGKLHASGFKVYEASRYREYIAPAKDTLDLHIENITDAWQQLSNFEILTLQLEEFEKYFELAVLHHLPYLTVIHGIGTGRLKEEIHERLRGRKGVSSFDNKYSPSHGYGATVISFKH